MAKDYLQMAKDAWIHSTDYIDTNYRRQWENNLRHFQSKHASDSKYLRESYKYRSRTFRPKTRAAERNTEASASAAFFSNNDVVNIQAVHPENKMQQASAEINQALLQYRLKNTIPWFQTLLGGLQDASTMGCVASIQYWDYEEIKKSATDYNNEKGKIGCFTGICI